MQDNYMHVAICRRLISRGLFPIVNKAFTACVVAFNNFTVYLTPSDNAELKGVHEDIVIKQQVPGLVCQENQV